MPEPAHAIPSHLEHILDAARIAPSYDNMQPWRFVVDGETLSLLVDHERDRSPANASGRMARIAIGASVECLLVRARRMGATVRFLPPRGNALVTMSISSAKRVPVPDKALVTRVTNRRLYDARALDDATFAWLHDATLPLDATRTLWFGRERVRSLAPLIEEGETLFYADPAAREAALRAVRFDVRDNEDVTNGVSLGSLELSATDRMALDALRRLPEERLVTMGVFEKMGARARRLVESASGVCVVVTRGSDPSADVAVGRCMQRAWLALVRRGLVAQPLTAIPALEAMLEAGGVMKQRDRVAALVTACRNAFPSLEKEARVAILMRIGKAPPPTAIVGRLPLAQSVAAASTPE
jgi:Nitroreductase family